MYLHSMPVKMTQILSVPFVNRSQLTHKERSTAKACNETLKVPDIERWNQEARFSKSPYFSRDTFCGFGETIES